MFGPDAMWPSHQKPYWNDALKLARDAGWSFTTGGHWFGVVSCPAGEHTFVVDKTARGGETKALEVPKLLRRCQHGNAVTDGSKVTARQAECERLLARAEELILTATNDVARAEEQQRAFAEWDRLNLVLDTAEATVDEVLAATQEEALERVLALENVPGQAAIGLDLDEASQMLETAATLASKIRRPGIADPLRSRANDAKAGIAALRQRLATI
ncbi:MAG TPA: hypothetical protein VJ851_14105 [Jatrophihabitans sp.]|nr:hypothetical protein [Jatrophihabitans sp.]